MRTGLSWRRRLGIVIAGIVVFGSTTVVAGAATAAFTPVEDGGSLNDGVYEQEVDGTLIIQVTATQVGTGGANRIGCIRVTSADVALNMTAGSVTASNGTFAATADKNATSEVEVKASRDNDRTNANSATVSFTIEIESNVEALSTLTAKVFNDIGCATQLGSETQAVAFVAAPAVASKLAITTQPSTSAQSGVVFGQQPVIQLQDASGNDVSEEGVEVTVAIASGGGALGGTLTATTDADGVATFAGLAITGTTGVRTLTFTATGLTSVTSGDVTITAGVASKLAVTTQPVGGASGAALTTQPVVTIQDAQGNTVTTDDTTVVTVEILSGGGGTLGGTLTATASSGVATFAGVTLAGTVGTDYVLRFTSGSLTEADSAPVTVTAGVASKLAITTEPVGGASGAALTTQPVVTIQDAQGNTVTTDSSTVVTVEILSGGGGTLGGTLTATASSGVATFAGVTLAGTVGTDYVLRFTSGSLTEVTRRP
jgi:hypothetical protein